jgi:chemotaxis protein methyltransferase CheR
MTDSREDRELDALKGKIHLERGFNCHFYKDRCLRRRLGVRMRARGTESFAEYATILDQDPAEYEILLDTLTINVTKFFRNAEVWSAIAQRVVPVLMASEQPQIAVWSAGCASGEEPYSVSILFHEHAARARNREALGRLRIVGTDIDRPSLDAARRAEYPDLALEETPPDLRDRWFSPAPPYLLREEARRNVSFVYRDLISDEPLAGQSLILCRNVIIYFDREIQERIFERFYDALLPGGFLVLGKVETLLGRTRGRLRPVAHRERIYQKPV